MKKSRKQKTGEATLSGSGAVNARLEEMISKADNARAVAKVAKAALKKAKKNCKLARKAARLARREVDALQQAIEKAARVKKGKNSKKHAGAIQGDLAAA